MHIEQEIFDLATMTSNAFGWQSEIAGHIGTAMTADESAAIIAESEDEYVTEVEGFAEMLPVYIRNEMECVVADAVADLQEFLGRIEAGYDAGKLEALTRADWQALAA